jgi:hypothetical protein
MKQSKKRIKNKQELTPKSGKKKELPKRTIVEFQFTTLLGVKFKNGEGARLKIMEDGGISCLVKSEERGWIPVKAKLDFIKLKTIIIKKKPDVKK